MEWMIRLLCDKKSELEQEIRVFDKDLASLEHKRHDKVLHVNELEVTLRLIRLNAEADEVNGA